ncbi:MAG: hypothetical protein JNN30_08670 [Rhodanobacteraceae bacterium]|nr:hypothetical protein [Rhodanobacteraceae bacterium]
MRILIVSDEVNPHGLSAAQLTQPGELSATLLTVAALNRSPLPESVLELPTDSLDQVTSRLTRARSDPTAYDVLIYFSHRIPNLPNAASLQTAFVSAVQQFLRDGGGVISFHHGIYRLPGKEAMQSVLGGEAVGEVLWNTLQGQNVINVAPSHFITQNGLSYSMQVAFADLGLGIGAGNYAAFNNAPDERYPQLTLLPGSGRHQILFASNYALGDGTHVLGYVYRQPDWAGKVVMYQPGEYQPNALSPGNNLQILLNAILYSRDWIHTHGFEG